MSTTCTRPLARHGKGTQPEGTVVMCMNCGGQIVKRDGRWTHTTK